MTVGFVGTPGLAVLRDGWSVQVRPVGQEPEEQIHPVRQEPEEQIRGRSVDAVDSPFFTRRPDMAREAIGGYRPLCGDVGGASVAGSCGVAPPGRAQFFSRRPQGS